MIATAMTQAPLARRCLVVAVLIAVVSVPRHLYHASMIAQDGTKAERTIQMPILTMDQIAIPGLPLVLVVAAAATVEASLE